MSQLNYDVDTNVMFPLKANPVSQVCKIFKSNKDPLIALQQSMWLAYGNDKCISVHKLDSPLAWQYLLCTIYPTPMSNKEGNMFLPFEFNEADLENSCMA